MIMIDTWVDEKDGQADRCFDKHIVSSGGGTLTLDPGNDEVSVLGPSFSPFFTSVKSSKYCCGKCHARITVSWK